MFQRGQHVEREEIGLHKQALVERAQALGEVGAKVELERVLHTDLAHLLLDLRRHERGKESATQHMVEDETTEVLTRRLDAMRGEHFADARQDGRAARDQAIEQVLLALLELGDGTRGGIGTGRGVGHDPRAAPDGGKRLHPQLALRQIRLHEQAVFLASLADQAHQGVPAARALELGGDTGIVDGERRQEVRRSHAAKVRIDPIAHARLERDDPAQPGVNLVHRGAHGAIRKIGLL